MQHVQCEVPVAGICLPYTKSMKLEFSQLHAFGVRQPHGRVLALRDCTALLVGVLKPSDGPWVAEQGKGGSGLSAIGNLLS